MRNFLKSYKDLLLFSSSKTVNQVDIFMGVIAWGVLLIVGITVYGLLT